MRTCRDIFFNMIAVKYIFLFYMLYSAQISASDYVNTIPQREESVMSASKVGSNILKAIDFSVNVISQESNLETQLNIYKDYFDTAYPIYPKNGPVNRYHLSHKQIIDIDLHKGTKGWESAYIIFNKNITSSEWGGEVNEIFFEKNERVFKGIFNLKDVVLNNDGEEVVSEYEVARYSYKELIFIDFKLSKEKGGKDSNDFSFSRVHIYTRTH